MADSATDQGKSRFGIISLVTLLGSAFIGLNTLVTSCAAEDAATNSAKLQAVEQDEQFWTGAIQELSEISRDKNKPDGNFESRCTLLASRTAPFIVEVIVRDAEASDADTPDDLKSLATDQKLAPGTQELETRVRKLREEFIRLISNESITSPDCKAEYEAALERAGTEDLTRKREEQALATEASPVPTDAVPSAQSEAPPLPQDRKPLIILSGLSAKGYDIDVFWCESGNKESPDLFEKESARNFENANRFGVELARISKENKRIAAGSRQYEIGQVRLRRLAPELWQKANSGYAKAAGISALRYGPNESGEKELANGIRAQSFGKGLALQPAPASTTPWYLSAFFCEATSNTAKATAAVARK